MASQLLGIKTRFTNDLGSPLVGGQVYTYFAGTSTNQDSYSDAALTVPNTNPVILDDTGSADIFLKGAYRIRVFDKSGRFIEEQDNVTQAASQGDATELSNKVSAVEDDLSTANTEINKVKLDTGITATAKFGGFARTQANKNSEVVSIYDFYNGEPTFSPALQRSVASGRSVFFPSGDYVFKETVTINEPDFTVYGNGRMLWDSDGEAGSTCILVQEGGFNSIGLKHKCTTVRRAFYRVNNPEKDIKGFLFDRCDFKDGFYSVRGGLLPSQNPNTTKIHGMVVRGCTSAAPTDVPAGHYIMSNSVGTKYLGNTCTGGSNTSVYGINFSSDFVIIGNTEKGVASYLNSDSEASIQIEDSDLANGVIANNICSHNIWISGANGIQVYGNTCAVLRVSVGNPLGYSVFNTVFSDNKCTSIIIAKYGAYTTTDTYSAVFKNTNVDPQFALRLGRAVPTRAISVQGSSYGKNIEFKNTEVISSASQYQTSIVRGSILNLNLEGNDFGTGANIQSGTGGIIRERAKYNPIFAEYSKNPHVAIGLDFLYDKGVSTSGTWEKLTGFTVIKDINGAFNSSTGVVTLPKGVYVLDLSLLIVTTTSGKSLGIRVVNQVGVELARLVFLKTTSTSSTLYKGSCSLRMGGDLSGLAIELLSEEPITITGSNFNMVSIAPIS
ncbi:hypothetical protein [Psychrobacter immobilis]|uniref:hypothetical protein n=1 Tax=Psychrobacter immobilis TaxID=498 RepID=UPI003FD0762F